MRSASPALASSPTLTPSGFPSSPSSSRFGGLSGLLRPRSNTATRRDAPTPGSLGLGPPSPSPGSGFGSPAVEPPASPGDGYSSERGGNYFSLRRRTSGRRLDQRARSPTQASLNASVALQSSTADDSGDGSTTSGQRIRLVPHLEATTRSLHFDPVSRDLKPSQPLRVGRFNERPSAHQPPPSELRLAFKSKVVSRTHAEIWCDGNGQFFIRDTKSSSGTFLNHIRLSAPGHESRPFPVKDGDIVQLGVDYQGGTEEMYRCVKIRIELGRRAQNTNSAFNANAMNQLKVLSASVAASTAPGPSNDAAPSAGSVTDCCICLFSVTVCQALFIAPCSHVYHYKCIRPLLQLHHPGFSCPLCRTFADLEADVETDDPEPVATPSANVDEDAVVFPAEPAVDRPDSGLTDRPGTAGSARSPDQASRSRRTSSMSSRRRPFATFTPAPDAGEFEREVRRASIVVAGPNGLPMPLTVTGRNSRPASVRNMNMSPTGHSPSSHTPTGAGEQPSAHDIESAVGASLSPRRSRSFSSRRPPSLSASSSEGEVVNFRSAASSLRRHVPVDDDDEEDSEELPRAGSSSSPEADQTVRRPKVKNEASN